jgi:radical SAM superfamily enzyme YgiQ (UPF0313 family)
MNELVHIIQTPPFWLKTPPLSLIYLKNYLQNRGYPTNITDLNIALFKQLSFSQKEWLTLNEQFEKNLFSTVENNLPCFIDTLLKNIKEAEFIGFPLLKRNTPFAFSLAEKIIERYPWKKIIFGGPHTLFMEKEKKLKNNPYFWIIGEGEIPLLKIIQNNSQKIYRFEEINDLDTLPFVDFSPLTLKTYSSHIPLLTSRGCTHNCNFCSEKLLFKKFRHHCPQYMVDQIKYLITKYKTNNFIFTDSMINYKIEWLNDFCNLLIDNKLKINWEAQIRVKKGFTHQTAELLKKSGCYNLFIGLESGSDKVLEIMNKGITTNDALDFFKKLKKAELHFEISLITGYPGETNEDFKDTMDFIVKNKKFIPKIGQINPFVDYLCDFSTSPFPKEEIRKRVATFLKIMEQEKIRYTKSFVNNLVYSVNSDQ